MREGPRADGQAQKEPEEQKSKKKCEGSLVIRPHDVRPGDVIDVGDHSMFKDIFATGKQRKQPTFVIASATEMIDPHASNELDLLDERGRICWQIEIRLDRRIARG